MCPWMSLIMQTKTDKAGICNWFYVILVPEEQQFGAKSHD